jgi:ABC-type lipoprotein release transport system permease subunit
MIDEQTASDFCTIPRGVSQGRLATRLLASLLFEVAPHDLAMLAYALLVLLLTTFLAAWIPARRAMRVDPLAALRYE